AGGSVTFLRGGRAPPAGRSGSGTGIPDLRRDRDRHGGGGALQGGARRLPRLVAGQRHRRGRRRRTPGARRERQGRARHDGRRRGAATRRAGRPDGRAEPRPAAAVPAVDRPPAAADRRARDRAGQAHRARRPDRQAGDGGGQPAPGGLDRQGLHGPRAVAARPHPGGLAGPDPRGREVRLPPRLQVLHLRDVVDPPGGHPRSGRQGPHHPDPRPHGRAAQQGHLRRASARPAPRSRADAGRDRQGARLLRARGPRHAADGAAAGLARQADRRRRRRRPRRPRRGRERGVAVRGGRRGAAARERAAGAQRPARARARGDRDALRAHRPARVHAGGGRAGVQRHARADPPDRGAHPAQAAGAAGGPAAARGAV
ncbi:MAG: RNA polymerase sigma factor RpoD, partial [uncultured Solirubrobacteraceae bacterium]